MFFEHTSLLLLQGFEAGHEVALLLGVALVLLVVCLHLSQQFLFVHGPSQVNEYKHAYEGGYKIVVVEARRVVVEDEEEDDDE